MPNNTLEKKFALWQHKKLKRLRPVMSDRTHGDNRIVINGQSCINFSSNDYLGLIQHPAITASMLEGIKKYGVGSGASAMVSGYFAMQNKLEQEFAQWLKVDSAILFNSGYMANLGIMASLLSRQDKVLSDKLCHASLMDGIQLSRAKHYRYRHNDMAALQRIAVQHKPDMIVTESIFSMYGDITPIADIIKITDQYEAGLIIDDAHGIGILGQTGRGIIEHYDLNQNQFSCIVLPLGKAFNGMGAMVAGSSETIETILQFSKSYRYSTALPPAMAYALQSALNIIQTESWRRHALNNNIDFFNAKAIQKNLRLISVERTPIRVMRIGDNQKVLDLQKFLWNEGLFVAAIRPPTVPYDNACVRISLNCLHTTEDIECLLAKIREHLS